MRSPSVIVVALAALALSAPASVAQSGSEFDQYVPDLPDAEGPKPLQDAQGNGDGGTDDGSGSNSEESDEVVAPPSSGGEPPEPSTAPAPPAEPVNELAEKGAEGEAAARFTQATTSQPAQADTVPLAHTEGESPGSSLIDLLGGPAGGVGALFPLLLVIMFGAAIVYALRRRGT